MPDDHRPALERLIRHAYDTDIFHVIASKRDFPCIDDWISFIFADTAYGAALILSDQSPQERLNHLHELWSDDLLHPMD